MACSAAQTERPSRSALSVPGVLTVERHQDGYSAAYHQRHQLVRLPLNGVARQGPKIRERTRLVGVHLRHDSGAACLLAVAQEAINDVFESLPPPSVRRTMYTMYSAWGSCLHVRLR